MGICLGLGSYEELVRVAGFKKLPAIKGPANLFYPRPQFQTRERSAVGRSLPFAVIR